MVSILIMSAILYIAAKVIHDDKELVDFSSMLGLVIAPAIVGFLVSMAISAFELPNLFQLFSILITVTIVFFFSNAIFEWGHKKSGALAGVYLISSVIVQTAMVMFMYG